jgi:hypothetical protein
LRSARISTFSISFSSSPSSHFSDSEKIVFALASALVRLQLLERDAEHLRDLDLVRGAAEFAFELADGAVEAVRLQAHEARHPVLRAARRGSSRGCASCSRS